VVFRFLLVKLAARCNINCSYCYWFRDRSVYDLPKVLAPEVETKLLERLKTHCSRHRLASFCVAFHGGEPLLFGKARMRALCARLAEVERETGTRIRKSITTNGLLLDREWVELLRESGTSVTLSLDGSRAQHDARRVDFRGEGTYERVVAALGLLRTAGIEPGILAVCDPLGRPEELLAAFADRLGIREFDVLVPDATHEDRVPSIRAYFTRLFDLWLDEYSQRGVRIRFLDNLLRASLGRESSTEAIGYGPISTLTMLSDGSLEPLDVLRIAGGAAARSAYNVLEHELQEVQHDPAWREAHQASLNLCATCNACEFHDACGGGYLPSRWSAARRYDNPSVYCEDLKGLFRHVWQRAAPTLYVARQ